MAAVRDKKESYRGKCIDGWKTVQDNPNYCVVAKLPKPCLPNRDVYGGVHKGLKELAGRALAEGT
jgi:hypothetical protein